MRFSLFLQAVFVACVSAGQQSVDKEDVWVDNQGRIAGLDLGLSVHAALDLARKLTFLHLKEATDMNPFAGLQVLNSLPPSAGQNLLLAAEYSRFFPDQAEEHLLKHLESPPKISFMLNHVLLNLTCKGQRTKAHHPIAVLVLDRIQVRPIEDAENVEASAKPFQSLVETEYADLLTMEEKVAAGIIDMGVVHKEKTYELMQLDVRSVEELDARFKYIKSFARLSGDLLEQIEQLENLVGLHNMKEVILNPIFFRLWTAPANHNIGARTHFCLVGGPGSGKTTAGKILKDILYHLGTYDSSDLIGKKIGYTQFRLPSAG